MSDDFTEAYDLDIDRVDLVGKAANGRKFVMLKAATGGLIDADTMADLIKDDPAPETVTLSGSPAAIARMIHDASLRKAAESTASINDLPDTDFAYVEPGGSKDESGKTTPRSLRHFPIQDAAHTRNALSRAPQSPFGDKALPKIHAAAKRFGIDVAKETPMTSTDVEVTKADDEPITTTEPAAMPDGDPLEPGSGAWEAIDAETAREGISLLGRAKAVIALLATREGMEGLAEHPVDGADPRWDLMDASDAIDAAIATLAVFAAGEDLEAVAANTETEVLGKAVALAKSAGEPLSVLEGYAPLVKAGKVLSAANETAIRTAVESLNQVLAALPQAPDAADVTKTTTEPEEAPMAKSDLIAAVQVSTSSAALDAILKDVAPATPVDVVKMLMAGGRLMTVTKAKGDPVTVVFDQNGKPLGVIDPKDLVPITGPSADGDGASDGDGDATPDDAAPADAPAEPAPGDGQPQADATDGPATDQAAPQTPAAPATDTTDVTKTADEPLTKSTIEALIKAAVEAATAPLQTRLETVEKQPLPGGPMLHGATFGDRQPISTRGQDDGAPEALRKAWEDETDPIRKQELQMQLAVAGVRNARRLS